METLTDEQIDELTDYELRKVIQQKIFHPEILTLEQSSLICEALSRWERTSK